MTLKATKFTPEALLSAPRRAAGTPTPSGDKVAYNVSTYSFESQKTKKELRLLDVDTRQDSLITDGGAGDLAWLDGKSLVLFKEGEKGVTKVLVGEADRFEQSHYEAGEINASASALKVFKLTTEKYAIAFAAQTSPDGSLYNGEKAEKPRSTGRLYTELFVRHWDYWLTPQRNSIWYSTLTTVDGKFKLGGLTNLLLDTGLESPTPPFGGGDDFDISADAVIFAAKDPHLNAATHTKMNIYIAGVGDWEDKPNSLTVVESAPYLGLASSPVFSPDGRAAAFLKMRQDGYEADKTQILLIPSVKDLKVVPLYPAGDLGGAWDRSPQSLKWSTGGTALYLIAEDQGSSKFWFISLTKGTSSSFALPEPIPIEGSISDIKPLDNGKALLAGSSLVENSAYFLFFDSAVASAESARCKAVSTTARNGSLFGLSRRQIDEIWYDGAFPGQKIHALVMKPSTFDPAKSYPLAFLIHGGPQGAWNDSWSTRWNPAIFAEQGYVVVAPNPTGSTGYGQALVDAIQGQWGGLPYQDLVKCFEHLESSSRFPYIDTANAVALGASYGGYMVNWIQGHDLGRKFKALVCHDGVFSMTGQLASEELWFPYHDLHGPLWEKPEAWAQWDPSRFAANWSTPQLVIHSEKDYRLTVSEGISAFNVLQSRGVKSRFLTFPDENHWVLKPENSLLWHKVVLDFINEFTGVSTA